MRSRLTKALSVIALVLLTGTCFYHYAEGWSWSDSFYFTGVTMLTIGYGDLHPTMPFTKVMTVIFGILTIGLVLFSISTLAKERLYLKRKLNELPSELRDVIVEDIRKVVKREKKKGKA